MGEVPKLKPDLIHSFGREVIFLVPSRKGAKKKPCPFISAKVKKMVALKNRIRKIASQNAREVTLLQFRSLEERISMSMNLQSSSTNQVGD